MFFSCSGAGDREEEGRSFAFKFKEWKGGGISEEEMGSGGA